MTEAKVIYRDKDYLVYYKPSGMPTVPLKNKKGGTLLELVSLSFPEVLEIKGKNEWEGSVIHRLDTPTSGLVLFALNESSYNYLLNEQKYDRIEKIYRAKTSLVDNLPEGFPPFKMIDNTISSSFRSYGVGQKSVRPTTKEGDRVYSTHILSEDNGTYICSLTRGFRHQIRAHLAWSMHPIIGDTLYGGLECDSFFLEAIAIKFKNQDGKTIALEYT